jgi:NADH-quinone oxidoreductase subunit H
MHWNVFTNHFDFLNLCFAETNRTPFDLAECETELIGGYHTEYLDENGIYLFAEYANMFISLSFSCFILEGITILEWLGLLKTGE